jgi:hypothetical protein
MVDMDKKGLATLGHDGTDIVLIKKKDIDFWKTSDILKHVRETKATASHGSETKSGGSVKVDYPNEPQRVQIPSFPPYG